MNGGGIGVEHHLRVIVERLRAAPAIVTAVVAANACGMVALNDPQRHASVKLGLSFDCDAWIHACMVV
jgi:hypothetical protein